MFKKKISQMRARLSSLSWDYGGIGALIGTRGGTPGGLGGIGGPLWKPKGGGRGAPQPGGGMGGGGPLIPGGTGGPEKERVIMLENIYL